ncbi:hypothetical protein V6248_08070 [Pseudoalteromonas agarivorans]|uniref:hypothetical protein n=1 Tax=Pseudoalteromonas agarivorans TaxID=176102 RepID=UPI00311E9055
MRNILILLCTVIAVVMWVSDIVLLSTESSKKKEITTVDLNTSDVTKSQFNIEQLAKTLGVNYQLISNEAEVLVEPSVIEITLSLVAIYTSGDMAKVRLRLNTPTGEETIDVVKGDNFESLELSNVSATEVELLNGDQTVQLKMYKPQVISITKTNGVEEVTK